MLDVRLGPSAPDALAVTGIVDTGTARDAGARVARGAEDAELGVDATRLTGARLSAFVEGLVLGCYRYSLASDRPAGLQRVVLAGARDEQALQRGLAFAGSAVWARDLTNTPAATKTPAWLAGAAAAELSPLGVEVVERDERWLAEHGFGGVLAVGGGAAAPPRLIEARWRPRRARSGVHPVLVGKGITFDTGGINLKPGASMRTMMTDMAGGAAVLAALRTVALLRLPVRLSVLVPAAENALSGSSFRPGDVVRHYDGRTSEIGNTDAEGRLVLADALGYATARLRPTALVDIATLTGAMKVALGLRTAGVFATSARLSAALGRAGAVAGEPLWPMPLHQDYLSQLDSPVADATNAPGNPGAITAALFLRPFAASVPWAHLDVAGPARAGADDGVISRGATGFGARLLAQWVDAQAR